MSKKRSSFPKFASGAFFVWGCILVGSSFSPAQSSEQQRHPISTSTVTVAAQEFPVTLRQNIISGKTPVGTKVEAKLTMATLVKGAVIPEGAVFTGEVVQSSAKSATDPSRLAIRIDSVQWKKETKPMMLYLTAWYYPLVMNPDPDGNDQAENPLMRDGTQGSLSGMRVPPSPPVALPPPPARVSESRVQMKDIECARDADGTIALTSSKSNIKLDKSTTYVLAANDLAPGKQAD